MATDVLTAAAVNKVVVAYLDGRRQRGCSYDFSPLKETFRVSADSDAMQTKSAEVSMKTLKAIFFVKDFRGNSRYRESKAIPPGKPGRKVEVTFADGEKVVGTTQAYNPAALGFFVYPADPKSNSLRIFVVNWNVRDVKFL
jgi:Family of unknown function (DUF6982)